MPKTGGEHAARLLYHRNRLGETVIGALGEGLSAGKVLRACRQLAALLEESD